MMIPLYHGSSQIYRDSIFRDGLGTPPTNGSDIPGYLASGFKMLAEKHGFKWEENLDNFSLEIMNTPDLYFICRAALNTAGNQFNLRYGQLYLTSSVHRARSYASETPESIRFGFVMHDLLERQQIQFTDHPFVKNFVPLREALQNAKPLVIQIMEYDLAKLFDEQGRDLRTPVAEEQRSFEYRGSIPPKNLKEI